MYVFPDKYEYFMMQKHIFLDLANFPLFTKQKGLQYMLMGSKKQFLPFSSKIHPDLWKSIPNKDNGY